MTLTRTIRRRNQRKARRAKLAEWARHPPRPFASTDWLMREALRVFGEQSKIADLFNRSY